MSDEILELSAYHESGRVVFTYLNGYWCDSIELSDADSGRGASKLNAGHDLPIVQAVLTGTPLSLAPGSKEHAIEVANKLMAIYCAGSCAESFFLNNADMPAELDMEISWQDLKKMEVIQMFLNNAIPGHPDDYPTQIVVSIFKKLKDRDIWKAIESLANKALKSEKNSLTRFYIEDTLMASGISIRKQVAGPAFSVDVQEDKSTATPSAEKKAEPFELPDDSPLDIMLKDFLMKVKKDWKEGELEAATTYVRAIFKKYG